MCIRDRVESVIVIDLDTIVRAYAFDASQDILHLRREHIRSADDEHIIGAGTYLLHARMSSPACARLGDHIAQVVRAVTQHGERLLIERREHQLARHTLRQRLAGLGIDDLPEEMILSDMLHVATREAFTRNAWTHHLGETVIISTDDVHAALDLFFERWRTRLATKEPDTQARILPIEAMLLAIFAHVHRIGRRGDEHGGLVAVSYTHLDVYKRQALRASLLPSNETATLPLPCSILTRSPIWTTL